MKAKFFSIILLLIFTSCGKRDEEHELTNYLDGQWRMNELNCYKDSSTPLETYQIQDSYDAVFNFNGRQITYTVTPNCGVTTTGNYIIKHFTLTSGSTTFYDVTGGGECTDDIADDKGSGVSTVDFEVTSSYTSELLWSYDKDAAELTMTFPTAFKGSSNTLYCNSECTCSGTFTSI